MEPAVPGADPAGFDAPDGIGDQFGVGPLDGGIEVGGDDQPLAGGPVVGPQPFAKDRVGHAVLEVGQACLFDHLDLGRLGVHHRIGEEIEHVRKLLAGPGQLVGIVPPGLALLVGVGRILVGHHPLRGALEQGQVGDTVDDGGDDLHRRRPGADDAHPCARPAARRGPNGRCGTSPPRSVHPVDLGVPGMVEHPGGGDDHVDHVAVPGGRRHGPPSVGEGTADDRIAEADPRHDAPILGHPLEIGTDLGAGGEPVAPFGGRGKGVGVQVRRDIAGQPRIGVLPPGPPDALGLLVDREIGEAGLGQPDGTENPGHTGADDRAPHPVLAANHGTESTTTGRAVREDRAPGRTAGPPVPTGILVGPTAARATVQR